MLCIALLLLIIETSNFKGPQNEFIVHVSPPRMCSTHTNTKQETHEIRRSHKAKHNGAVSQLNKNTRRIIIVFLYIKKMTTKFSNCKFVVH